jgi:legumain
MKFITLCAIALIASSVSAANWAVIVAGSNGYWNYRHQADTCHAYQILKAGGIPADNIIHFAYDDVANNSQNPFPGKLFNHPDGTDVYGGCVIDYKGAQVTPSNYLKVLRGDASAGGKVLKSTADDIVFLNFADHGAPGLIAFPSSYLYAKDLLSALQAMSTGKMFKKLVYYLEACESGSMFENLPTNLNIYAVTAANDHESSWGTYCSPNDMVNGQHIGSCLGDLFSVNWMENTDSIDTSSTTVGTQVDKVVSLTTKSHVMQYGDQDFRKDMVSLYQGAHKPSTNNADLKKRSMVDSRDIKLHYLINKHANELSEESMSALNEEILSRKSFDDLFTAIRVHHDDVEMAKDTDFDCYKNIINFFEATCGKFSEYGMKYMRSFYDVCMNKQEAIPAIKETIVEFCPEGQLF